MFKNSLGRQIPERIAGIKNVKPYSGAFNFIPSGNLKSNIIKNSLPGRNKILKSIKDAIIATELKDGMTISFHHHLRNGDFVVNMVLDTISEMGIRDIKIAPTALFGVHKHITKYIENGTITAIYGSVNGPIGKLVSEGAFEVPVILRSHGGRARAVESGDLEIDVAFIASPCCDKYGNITGKSGKSACGSLGYAYTDAANAKKIVAITDNLLQSPIGNTLINQTMIDYIVEVEKIGDPKGIVSGTTQITKDPSRLLIANFAAEVMAASGLMKNGFSFQTGAGGISLAVTKFIKEKMIEQNIKASFGSGGITSYFVDMLEEGLIDSLYDVQSFDLEAVKSIERNANHFEMSASMYANPHNTGCIVNNLDMVVLGATEVDINFNVNVNTEADGALLHGIGGHQDTAAGAKLTLVVAPLLRGRIPLVVDSVQTITTPGETIDGIVTEHGIAINPTKPELIEKCRKNNLPILTIEELYDKCTKFCGKPEPFEFEDKIIGVVEYRDGTILDTIRKIKN